MKHLKYLLLICLAAAAACSKDKTEDPTLKAQRTALQETQAVGIYRTSFIHSWAGLLLSVL